RADPQALAPATAEQEQIIVLENNLNALRGELAAAQGAQQQDEQLKKQVELLQKQIEVQQKMIELLLEQVKKQQTDAALLGARSQQAARRDQELGQAIDNVTEHLDATERNGPRLPASLKQLFDPFANNESPLSIYGTLAVDFTKIHHQPGKF